MGKKNKYRKALLAAKELPIVMKDSHENHIEKGWEMIARGQTEINGEPILPHQIYINPMPVSMAINHKRRIKKLINAYGPEVVEVYVEANQSINPKS